MKNSICARATICLRGFALFLLAIGLGVTSVRAGLNLEIHLYRNNQGLNYAFYTPLTLTATAPAAPDGTYIVMSPGWPTNGSQRAFSIDSSGISDINALDSEYGYGDFDSAIQQITGTWSILYTSPSTTNLYQFNVTIPTVNSNMLPATIITFPADGSLILTNQTSFTWQGATNWPVTNNANVYGDDYYQHADLPASQTNWNVDSSFPVGTNYSFYLQMITNYTTPLFVTTTPLGTNNSQPISAWSSTSVLESGSYVNFKVFVPGAPTVGHVCLAFYSFEDNNLFAHDFAGNNNDVNGYAWFNTPPVIVTNDAEFGMYSLGLGGSGWITPSTNIATAFESSFSVSLWLKTTNVYGQNSDDEYSAAGIVSALGEDINQSVLPMGQTGTKLAFYTGGSFANILRSRANINTGQYIHLVVTRDQNTGQKCIYVNGALDSTVYASTDVFPYSGGEEVGYNNGNVFTGELDQIQFYSGVLSSNDVASLFQNPASIMADTSDVSAPLVARYDFEQTNNAGFDSSGHNNISDCYTSNGIPDIASTNAATGSYARQFFGQTAYCFYDSGFAEPRLSTALSQSFTVTAWANTTNVAGTDGEDAFFGNPIFFTYSGNIDSTVPLSITGSKAAFTVYDGDGIPTTLHSTTKVNDGKYHFLAAVRNQTTGVMNLYVDGQLEATGTNTTDALNINDVTLAGGYLQYVGLLDDVRLYSGALTPDDIGHLSANPTFDTALNTANLLWNSTGDSIWFVETTNTYDNVMAAQSGVVTNYQTSTLSVTVNGPGYVSFYWSSFAEDPNFGFDYEFDIDGNYQDDIYGDNGWFQDGPFFVDVGQHTLTWTVSAFGDTDPTQVGYLDQVSFVTAQPVSLSNPVKTDSNFQFQVATQSGFNHDIQYRTNLVEGTWQTYQTINGDGSTPTINVPLSVFGGSGQGFVRVTTY